MREHHANPMQMAACESLAATGGAAYQNAQLSVSFGEAVDATCLREAWQSIVAANGILRSSFRRSSGGEVFLREYEAVEAPWRILDWQSVPATDLGARWQDLLDEDANIPIDPGAAPLVRFTLITLPNGHTHMLASYYKALLDETSLAKILCNWLIVYEKFTSGIPAEMPAPVSPEINDTSHLPPLEDFWRQVLSTVTPPAKIVFYPRQPLTTETKSLETSRVLGRDTTKAIHAFCKSEGISLHALLLAAWNLIIARLSGNPSCLMLSEWNCSALLPADSMPPVSLFTQMLPLVTNIVEDQKCRDWLHHVSRRVADTGAHAWVDTASAIGFSGLSSTPEDFPIGFALRGPSLNDLIHDSMPRWIRLDARLHSLSAMPLFLEARSAERIEFKLFSNALPALEAETMLLRLAGVLTQFLQQIEQPLSQITILTPSESSDPDKDPVSTTNDTVHEIFRKQARKTPTAAAVIMGEHILSYSELDMHSDTVASALMQRGLTNGWAIGLCMMPSPWLAVALLGILKAGNTSVPVDPESTLETIENALTGHDVEMVLCDAISAPRLINESRKHLVLDREWENLHAAGEALPHVPAESVAAMLVGHEFLPPPSLKFITHKVLAGSLQETIRIMGLEPGSLILPNSPAGGGGYLEEWLAPLLCGAAVTTSHPAENPRPITHQRMTSVEWSNWVHQLVTGFIPFPDSLEAFWIEAGHVSPEVYTEWQGLNNGRIRWVYFYSPAGLSGLGLRYISSDRYGASTPLALIPEGMVGPEATVKLVDFGGHSLPPGYAAPFALTLPHSPQIGNKASSPTVSTDLSAWRNPAGFLHLFSHSDQHQIPTSDFELISRVLNSHPAVWDAHIARINDGSITAWLVADESPEDIGMFLSEHLPIHLRPRHIYAVAELPVTRFGWVDPLQLPTPVAHQEPIPDEADVLSAAAEISLNTGSSSHEESWIPIARLRATGIGPILFLVHDLAGRLSIYTEMVSQMWSRRPVYGFHARGLYDPDSCHRSIEATAASYIEAMAMEDPLGPYHIAGFGYGALIAFEMARQLETAGREVADLVLIGAPPPEMEQRRDWMRGLARDISHALKISSGQKNRPDVEPFPEAPAAVTDANRNACQNYRGTPISVPARIILPRDLPKEIEEAWLACAPNAEFERLQCAWMDMLDEPAVKRLASILDETVIPPEG